MKPVTIDLAERFGNRWGLFANYVITSYETNEVCIHDLWIEVDGRPLFMRVDPDIWSLFETWIQESLDPQEVAALRLAEGETEYEA